MGAGVGGMASSVSPEPFPSSPPSPRLGTSSVASVAPPPDSSGVPSPTPVGRVSSPAVVVLLTGYPEGPVGDPVWDEVWFVSSVAISSSAGVAEGDVVSL